MESTKWNAKKVFGRDEILHDIEDRAVSYSETVVSSVRAVMQDYEVDMYRLVLTIGKHYGQEKAYELMSETVSQKRLRWLEQVKDELELSGTEVEKGFQLFLTYFKLTEDYYQILKKSKTRIIFKHKDYIDAIAHACDELGLDVIEVNNKVYGKSMNELFKKINLNAVYLVSKFHDGWYEEMIEVPLT